MARAAREANRTSVVQVVESVPENSSRHVMCDLDCCWRVRGRGEFHQCGVWWAA